LRTVRRTKNVTPILRNNKCTGNGQENRCHFEIRSLKKKSALVRLVSFDKFKRTRRVPNVPFNKRIRENCLSPTGSDPSISALAQCPTSVVHPMPVVLNSCRTRYPTTGESAFQVSPVFPTVAEISYFFRLKSSVDENRPKR